MNYTKNYRLPQWVKEDRIMMDDFNAAMSSMESGMTASTATANAAKQTADTAKQTADTAHSLAQQISGAAYSPSNKPYKAGSYVGDGKTRTIHLGFRPSFLVISGAVEDSSGSSAVSFTSYSCVTAGQIISSRVAFTDTGFTVTGTNGQLPNFSDAGRTYDYIAFR